MVAQERVYLLLYKPKGYITYTKGFQGRPTRYDLIGDLGRFVVPVGRLDLDTSGLLLMTNDTRFAEQVMNPEFKIPRKNVSGQGGGRTLRRATRSGKAGLELKDGPTRPAIVTHLRDSAKHTFFEITITEGRNRQIRRMVEAVGTEVLKLVRTAIGPISMEEGCRSGGVWALTEPELRSLLRKQ